MADPGPRPQFDFLAPLMQLRPITGGFELDTLVTPHGAIWGTSLLFQQVLLAEQVTPGKHVLSMQTIFANGGRSGRPLQARVERLQDGRTFTCLTVTLLQDGVTVSRAEVLLSADEDDFIRHQTATTPPLEWPDWPAYDPGHWPGSAVRSPRSGLDGVAIRFGLHVPVGDPATARALIAICTEPEMMRGFLHVAGIPDAAGERAPGSVLAHTITFVESPEPLDAVVMTLTPRYAGHGRAHGEGQLIDDGGRLLATFSSTGLLRAPRPG